MAVNMRLNATEIDLLALYLKDAPEWTDEEEEREVFAKLQVRFTKAYIKALGFNQDGTPLKPKSTQ